jgi:tetratricopeptide (TPR) repeat protein
MTLGVALAGFGDFANYAAQAEKALEIRQRLLGPAHSDTLWSVATLATAKHHLGRRNEAQKLLEEGMAVARTATNGWSVGGASLVAGYGMFLTYDGRSAEALPYLKESIALLKQTMDPKDPRIKHAMMGLAVATQWAGQLQKRRR